MCSGAGLSCSVFLNFFLECFKALIIEVCILVRIILMFFGFEVIFNGIVFPEFFLSFYIGI